VKLDGDMLLTVPVVPPAAGPDRTLDPILAIDPGFAVCTVLAPAEPPLELALTIPYPPPASTTTVAPRASGLLSLRVSIAISFGSNSQS
jgi:hypothetical protein